MTFYPRTIDDMLETFARVINVGVRSFHVQRGWAGL